MRLKVAEMMPGHYYKRSGVYFKILERSYTKITYLVTVDGSETIRQSEPADFDTYPHGVMEEVSVLEGMIKVGT